MRREYSWVPEGLRRNIQLMPGQQEDTSTDSVNDNLNPSHVEVYVVTNNDAASIERWQFPSGGPGKTPIAFARVEIYQERLEIVGTVAYEDGSTASDTAKLDQFGRPCPTE